MLAHTPRSACPSGHIESRTTNAGTTVALRRFSSRVSVDSARYYSDGLGGLLETGRRSLNNEGTPDLMG